MFDASEFFVERLPWTGRADELRSQRAGVALVSELGRNYDDYHGALASRLAEIGRPEPAKFKTLQEYLEAWSEVQHIVKAEHLLRVARIVSSGGRPPQPTDSPPLVGESDRLLHLDEALEVQTAWAATATSP